MAVGGEVGAMWEKYWWVVRTAWIPGFWTDDGFSSDFLDSANPLYGALIDAKTCPDLTGPGTHTQGDRRFWSERRPVSPSKCPLEVDALVLPWASSKSAPSTSSIHPAGLFGLSWKC